MYIKLVTIVETLSSTKIFEYNFILGENLKLIHVSNEMSTKHYFNS